MVRKLKTRKNTQTQRAKQIKMFSKKLVMEKMTFVDSAKFPSQHVIEEQVLFGTFSLCFLYQVANLRELVPCSIADIKKDSN